MLMCSRCVVLRCTRYGDDALIVDVLTEAAGRVSLLVKQARSARAAVRHTLFRPLAVLEIAWEQRASRALVRPKTARVAFPQVSIDTDVRKATVALFLSEFLTYALQGEEQPGLLFAYIIRSIAWLDASTSRFANFHLVFLLRLARFLGISPNLEGYTAGCYFDLAAGRFVTERPLHPDVLPPAEAALLPKVSRMDYATMHVFRFTGAERSHLLDYILTFYRLHLPALPELRSMAVLRDTFS